MLQKGRAMADSSRQGSQEYWRPAPQAGSLQAHGFQMLGNEAFCTICGTPYAAGARFCHVCGLVRDEDLHLKRSQRWTEWLDLDALRTEFGLSNLSLVLLVAAAIFLLAALGTGLIHSTTTVAEWQGVQNSRIEWLLASVAALLAAMIFKTRP
jgi:hypothetical protein